MKKTKIFGHRGASAMAPENTLEAFALAIEQGADGVELDVQMTKDGNLVVAHDEVINRVSNGTGAIRDYTLKQLKQFSFNCTHPEYKDAVIPTLKEVLELIKPSELLVNIELKTGIFWYDNIEKETAKLVKAMDMEERVIYSSFNHYSVQKMRQLCPKSETAYLYSDVMLHVEEYAKKTGVQGLHPALYHVKMSDFLEQYKKSGLAVRVWTVDKEDDIQFLIENGVDAIITNDPEKAVKQRANICLARNGW